MSPQPQTRQSRTHWDTPLPICRSADLPTPLTVDLTAPIVVSLSGALQPLAVPGRLMPALVVEPHMTILQGGKNVVDACDREYARDRPVFAIFGTWLPAPYEEEGRLSRRELASYPHDGSKLEPHVLRGAV